MRVVSVWRREAEDESEALRGTSFIFRTDPTLSAPGGCTEGTES